MVSQFSQVFPKLFLEFSQFFPSFSQVVPRVFPVFPKFFLELSQFFPSFSYSCPSFFPSFSQVFPTESLLFVSRKLSLEQAPLFAALAASASGRMKEFTTQRLGGDGTSNSHGIAIFFWDEASWFTPQ